jgi:hypothetical protein
LIGKTLNFNSVAIAKNPLAKIKQESIETKSEILKFIQKKKMN